MELKKQRGIALAVPAATAWDFIQDLEAAASCFPGASITERLGDGKFNGKVRIKLGPVTAQFAGVVEITELDPSSHTIVIAGSGTDGISASRASMELRAVVEDRGDAGSAVIGQTTVTVTGKLATLGGRMIDSVADRLLDQFAASFTDKVSAHAAIPPASAAEAPETAPEPPKELNVAALILSVLWDRIKRLFGRGPAGP